MGDTRNISLRFNDLKSVEVQGKSTVLNEIEGKDKNREQYVLLVDSSLGVTCGKKKQKEE